MRASESEQGAKMGFEGYDDWKAREPWEPTGGVECVHRSCDCRCRELEIEPERDIRRVLEGVLGLLQDHRPGCKRQESLGCLEANVRALLERLG